ncbi:alpha/beta hydrolase [Nitrosomonas sp. ANs5]|uniref:alpha/beta hydrolase n=1 Tax=Nitrosomonas sp. ANs5 TaxID=3423941 RepID=UPI003D328ECF
MLIALIQQSISKRSARKCCIALLITVLVALLTGCASRLMLYPELARSMDAFYQPPPAPNGYRLQAITVSNDSGHKLRGLLFESEGDIGTVIVSGGNAMSRHHTLEYYRFLLGHGFRVLVISFQGYDDNEGRADLYSLVGDVAAFHSDLKSRYPDERIAYSGHSISSAAGLCLPLRTGKLAAIIVEGAFDPKSIAYTKLKQAWYLWPLFPILLPTALIVSATSPNAFDVTHCINTYSDIPIIFVHHPDDRVTPYRQALSLFSKYRGSKQFLVPQQANPPHYHANLRNDESTQKIIIQFLQTHLSARSQSSQTAEDLIISGGKLL